MHMIFFCFLCGWKIIIVYLSFIIFIKQKFAISLYQIYIISFFKKKTP